MSGHDEDPDVDDVTALMESLWGPREHAPDHALRAAPVNGVSRMRRDVAAPAPDTPVGPGPTAATDAPLPPSAPAEIDLEAVRRSLEPVIREQLAVLRTELFAAVASVGDRLGQRIDGLSAQVEADATRLAGVEEHVAEQLDADAAGRMAVLRQDAVGVADARIAGAETRLLARLDDIALSVAKGAEASVDVGQLSVAHDETRAEVGRVSAAMAELEDRRRERQRADRDLESLMQGRLDQLAAAATQSAADVRAGLEAMQARVDSDMDGHVAAVRDDAAASEARIAAVEGRVLVALDDVARNRKSWVAGQELATTRVDAIERDAVERLAALEEQLGGEVRRIDQAVARLEATAATKTDLDAVRATLLDQASALTRDLDSLGRQVAARAGMAARLDEVQGEMAAHEAELSGSISDVGRRLDVLGEHVSGDVARLGQSIRAEHLALATLRQELGSALAEQLGGEVRRIDHAVLRLEASAATKADLAAAEAEARRLTSVVDDATSDAVEQLAERLDEMAAWILAEAKRVSQGGAATVEASGQGRRRTVPPGGAAPSPRSTGNAGTTGTSAEKPAAVDATPRRKRMVLAARPAEPPTNGRRPAS